MHQLRWNSMIAAQPGEQLGVAAAAGKTSNEGAQQKSAAQMGLQELLNSGECTTQNDDAPPLD